MKTILDLRRHHYLATVSIFLIMVIMVALIAGMIGCAYMPPPSQNLKIRTWYDLDAVRNNLNGNHILMNDLDSATPGYAELAGPTANEGNGWEPIGVMVVTQGFFGVTGTFHGQGYEICDLFVSINRPEGTWGNIGLFGAVEYEGVIEDIGVVNATVIGDFYVGALVGWNKGVVRNCYSTGTVTGRDQTGFIDHIHHVGGLVGINDGTVSNSYSTANVTANVSNSSEVGGLAGQNDGAVNNAYSTGNVNGGDNVGGLVGNGWGTVSNCYSTGNVTGDRWVGGLLGQNYYLDLAHDPREGAVSNSYSIGSVTGEKWVGGLVGANHGHVSDSFWDTESSGMEVSGGGIGKTMAEMQDIATFRAADWDITPVYSGLIDDISTWNIVPGSSYPFLSGKASWRFTIPTALGIVGAVIAAGMVIFLLLRRRKRAAWIRRR